MGIGSETPDIDRTEAISLVRALLDGFEAGATPERPIVNIYGIAGLGKTWALKQIYRKLSPDYPTLLIRLTQHVAVTNEPAGEALTLGELLARLNTLSIFGGPINPPEGVDCASGGFELVASQPIDEGRPLLLLIDGVGDFTSWHWLQEALLIPLKPKPVVTVLTSYLELGWDFWDLEQRVTPYKLEQFSTDELRDYLRQMGLEHLLPLADNIYDYTQGYPLAVQHFVRQLRDTPLDPPGSPADEPEVWHQLSVNTRELLGLIGVIRLAEVDVMVALLEGLGAKQFTQAHVLVALAELTALGYLGKTQHGLPRRLDPRLRRAVELHEDADTLAQTYHQLEQIYAERADQRPKSRAYALLEWLYYSAPRHANATDSYRDEWAKMFRRLMQRATAVNQEDKDTASPVLFVLFYRDYELIERLREHQLYDLVRKKIDQFLVSVEGLREDVDPLVLVNRAFGVDFDKSCQAILLDLYARLPFEQLPPRLQDSKAFTLNLRRIINPDRRNDQGNIDLTTLSRRVSLETRLPPGEIKKVVTFLHDRGFISGESGTISFHPLIKSLVAFGDEKSRYKAMLSVTTNSPQ